jgi:hypothetical protein
VLPIDATLETERFYWLWCVHVLAVFCHLDKFLFHKQCLFPLAINPLPLKKELKTGVEKVCGEVKY